MHKTIYTEEYARLIAWMKEMRVQRGLTQRDLAEIIDCDNAIIARIETCQRRLDLVEYAQICKALECDPSDGLKIMSG